MTQLYKKLFASSPSPIPSDYWNESVIFTATADDVMENRFSFYGETHQLPEQIDFEADIGTAHWIVDLNRFPYIETLCNAFRRTGDEKYARKCIDLILSWISQSHDMEPRSERVMCRSYLNIAIHLTYWIKALVYIEEHAPHLISEDEMATIMRSIGRQLVWLDRKIPTQASNWVFIGCRGMLVTLAFCQDVPGREELVARSWQRVAEALKAQVLADGVQEEMATHYHAVIVANVVMMLDHAHLLPDSPHLPEIVESTQKMLRYLEHTMTPDGLHVAFGDSDADFGPRVVKILEHPIARRLLGGEYRVLTSTCFPYGGMMFLREGSDKGRDELYLAFDGGSFGTNHAHEDKLGFWITAYGRSLIVDPGRHLYDRSEYSYRKFLNSTAGHSTVMIDGLGQNCFAIREQPGICRNEGKQPIYWEEQPDGSIIAGAYYNHGYGPEHLPVTHFRIFFYFADLKCWAFVDSIEGEGAHLVESRLQFAPGRVEVSVGVVRTLFPDANLAVKYQTGVWSSVRVECGQDTPQRGGWYSIGYNQLEPAPAVVFAREEAALPFVSRFVLLPYRGNDYSAEVLEKADQRAAEGYQTALHSLKQTVASR